MAVHVVTFFVFFEEIFDYRSTTTSPYRGEDEHVSDEQ